MSSIFRVRGLLFLRPATSFTAAKCFSTASLFNGNSAVLSRRIAKTYTKFRRFESSSASNEQKPEKDEEKEPLKVVNDIKPPRVYIYPEVKKLSEHSDPNKILVDVREPDEHATYAIPGSINIPYVSAPGAWDLSPEKFKDVFKFEKPDKNKELIFYCVAGVRSTAAAELAQMAGYKHLGNYIGSLQDWTKHEHIELLDKEDAKAKGEDKESK